MKSWVTDHARQQFVSRVEYCPPADVDARIQALFARSSKLRERGTNNAERWRLDDPLVEFLAKRDGGNLVIVTVIGPEQIEREAKTAEEVLAAFGPVGPLTTPDPAPEANPTPKTPKVDTPGGGQIVITLDWHTSQDAEKAKHALIRWARHMVRPRAIGGAFITASRVREGKR